MAMKLREYASTLKNGTAAQQEDINNLMAGRLGKILGRFGTNEIEYLDNWGIGLDFFYRIEWHQKLDREQFWKAMEEFFFRFDNRREADADFYQWKKQSGLKDNADVLLLMVMPAIEDFPGTDIGAIAGRLTVDQIVELVIDGHSLKNVTIALDNGIDNDLMESLTTGSLVAD